MSKQKAKEPEHLTLHAVENLSAAELKANRDELVAGIDPADKDLPRRYVQARYDAKARDEKLAKQGARITELETALASATERGDKLEAELKERTADLKDARTANKQLTESLRATQEALGQSEHAAAKAQRRLAELEEDEGAEKPEARLR